MSLMLVSGSILSMIFILPLLQQGVSLVIVIFGLASAVSILVGLCSYVWYGFSLFLIYVGSLLVMFGYVVAMIPNFLFKQQSFFFFLVSGFFISSCFGSKMIVSEGVSDVGGFMYSLMGYSVLLGLGFILLFTLICVVKICYFSKGSLRPFEL